MGLDYGFGVAYIIGMTGAGMLTGADLREDLRDFFAAGFLAAFFAARFLVAFFAAFLAGRFLAAALRAPFFTALRTAFFAAFLTTRFLAALRTAFFAAFFTTRLAAALRTAFFATFLAARFLATLRTAFFAAALRTPLRAVFFVAFLADFFAAFFMAMGWLLVSGLAWLKLPSSKRRRGSRTRDQPPTRKARRDGFGMPRQHLRGNKKPAAPGVAGSFENGVVAFREGNEACIHRHLRPGGGAFCASRCRVFSTHSFPQRCLLGAKPNYRFFLCQQPPTTFFHRHRAVRRPAACRRGRRARHRDGMRRRCMHGTHRAKTS